MRPCTALRHSGAIHICRPGSVITKRSLYSSKAAALPSEDDDATTTRNLGSEGPQIDRDGKAVKTAVGDLPLSPVMDPAFWEARDRFTKRKPKGGKPENFFERQFRKNPFAQALATPVRLDTVTKLRMPTFFLQDFSIISHPETNRPWWVPRSLALRQPPTATVERDEVDDTLDNRQEETGAEKSKVLGPSAYILARRDLLKSFAEERKGAKRARASQLDMGNSAYHRRLFALSGSRFRGVAGQAVWREDMDEFVLHQMRGQIVQDLIYLSGLCKTQSRYYIVKCYGWDDIKFKHKGAVLWFGSDVEEGTEPGPFATFDSVLSSGENMSLVVHNIPTLLGSELTKTVREDAAALKDGSIFMLAGRRTTDLQLRLWKLQGYMYDFKGPT
ncbi:hypothetical protein SCARD494_04198 [Seiridium cardinale]